MAGNTASKKPILNKWSLAYSETPAVVLSLYDQYSSARLFYHSFSFSRNLAKLTEDICVSQNLSVEDTAKAGICAWFYCTGRLINYAEPLEHSQKLLNEFLLNYSLALSIDENDAIYITILKHSDMETSWQIALKDALIAGELALIDELDMDLKRLEDDFNLTTDWDEKEWEYFKLQQLLEARFISQEAKVLFEQKLSKAILLQKSDVERISKENKNNSDNKKAKRLISNRRLQANIQSYLRVGFRNHIELTKMADTRAHIMISVNSILTGALVSLISYQNLPETHPKLLIPVGVFMITSLTSLIFAILCARPRFIRSIQRNSSDEMISVNLASFSNFTLLSLDQYEEAIDKVFTDNYMMITNLKRELYNTGKILDTKYKFLGFSYNIFMFGFVSCVVLFMIIYLMG